MNNPDLNFQTIQDAVEGIERTKETIKTATTPKVLSSSIDFAISDLRRLQRGLSKNTNLYLSAPSTTASSGISTPFSELEGVPPQISASPNNFNTIAAQTAAAAQQASANTFAAEAANIAAAQEAAEAARRNAEISTKIQPIGLKKLPATLSSTTQTFQSLGPKTGIRLKGGRRTHHRTRNQKKTAKRRATRKA
jgi:hypothetical protein